MRSKLGIALISIALVSLISLNVYGQTTTVLVSKNAKGVNWQPDIAVDSKGNALIVWIQTAEGESAHHIYAARARLKGSKLKAGKAIPISGELPHNRYPTIAYQELSDTFLVVWEGQGDDGYSLQTREIDTKGQPAGSEKTLLMSEAGFYLRPKLVPVAKARKSKKSYLLVWYQVDNPDKRGAYSALLSSTGDLSKKPKLVLETLYGNSGNPEVAPTWLKQNPNGGYLLGVRRIESADFQTQRGHLLQLNKAGKLKKDIPLDAGDYVGEVNCEVLSEDRILVNWYDINFGTANNQMFDASLNPVGESYRAYSGVCNYSLLNMVGDNLYQIFKVSFLGFFVSKYDNTGEVVSDSAFVQAEYGLHGVATSVSVPGTNTILIANMKVHTAGVDHAIYCVVYNVSD